MIARACLLVALGGCATEVVGWRKNGTFVEGDLVAREGEVLIIQEPFFSHDVAAPRPDPLRVPVSSLKAIRYDRPGAASFALGALSTVAGVILLSAAYSSHDELGENGWHNVDFSAGALSAVFLGVGFWQVGWGIQQLEDADALLGPALDLPAIPRRAR